MNGTLLSEVLVGAVGGLIDGHLRQRPLADAVLTGVAIKVTQMFVIVIVGLNVIAACPRKVPDSVLFLTTISCLAIRIGIIYASLQLGYIGNAVTWGFIGTDTVGTLAGIGLHYARAFVAQNSSQTL